MYDAKKILQCKPRLITAFMNSSDRPWKRSRYRAKTSSNNGKGSYLQTASVRKLLFDDECKQVPG